MLALRWRIIAAILLALFCVRSLSAGPNYYAIVIRSLQPPDPLVLEKFLVNGESKLCRLAREGALPKGQYNDLAKISLGEIQSFRVVRGYLHVRTQARGELLAVPANFKVWSRGPMDPAAITGGSSLSGQLAPKQPFSAGLKEGWAVYVFSTRPNEDTLAFAVAETQNTQEAWEDFLRRFPVSGHARTARESLAPTYLARARQALSGFQEALRERKPGYRNLGEARQWFNRLHALNVPTPAQAEVSATLARLESEMGDRLRQARLQAENADFTGAQTILEPLLHFRGEFPELAAALEDIQLLGAIHQRDQARRHLAESRFDEAMRSLEAAASYKELPELAALRKEIQAQRAAVQHQQEIQQILASARQAVERRDYGKAFETLAPAARRYPEEAPLQEYFVRLQRQYREKLLAEVVEVEKLHTPLQGRADEEILINLHRHLARLGGVDSATELLVWRDRLSKHLADYYRQQAAKLAQRQGSAPSALAFAYLQQAYHFALNKSELTEFPTWRDQLERQLRIRVALDFRDLTPAAGGQYLVAELLTQSGAAIQKSGLPHLEILEVRRGETLGPAIELVVELLQATVRDDPKEEPVTSEYSGGILQVLNPQWREAEKAYERAQKTYEDLRTQVAAKRKRKYSKKEQQADAAGLAQAEAAAKQAKEQLDGVTRYVDREDVRPYEFVRRTVVRTADIHVSYRWVNALAGLREVQQIGDLKDRETAQAVEVTGVHPADKRGHRNQPAALPDAETLRGLVLRKIEQQLAERSLAYLKSVIDRDFERGRQKAEQAEREGAAEHYLRFLFNSPADDLRRQQALDYLQREFRLVALEDWLGGGRERP